MSGERRDAPGLSLLAERIATIPDALRRLGTAPNPPLSLGEQQIRRFVTTGLGSSRAHARFLADRLAAELGLWAESVPLSSLASPPPHAERDVLIVFSQGLAPNVRPLLSASGRWARTILVTAARENGDADDAVHRTLRELRAAGGTVRSIPAEGEFGTLMRVVGPMIGYLECLRVVAAVAPALGLPAPAAPSLERIVSTVERASTRLERILADATIGSLESLERGLAFVALGRYGALALNLQYKVLEGMLLGWPPLWDLLEFAHGPFQQVFDRPVTLLALTHAGDETEAKLLVRLDRMLVPERHRRIVLDSTLPGPLAIFEHEALLDALVLRFATERRIDPARWPGRGLDGPLYYTENWQTEDWREGAPEKGSGVVCRDGPKGASHERLPTPFPPLGQLTWPELERAVAEGRKTAVLPLGSTEQHGPHLPFATDTQIADALADRFCARVPEAIRLPAVAIGCSSEHLGFPGTLTLQPETLAALLRDLLEPLAACSFEKAFVFSAHGGNYGPLARALPDLREAAAPLEVVAFTDLDALTAAFRQEAAAHGISAEVSGHHAGETETSIMLALDPASVRGAALAAGFVEPAADPQALFYPRLRAHAENGTVGDPRAADAARGERYLDAWVGLLVAAYRGEKNQR